MSGGYFTTLPQGLLAAPSTNVLAPFFIRLADMAFRFEFKRAVGSMSKHIDERRRVP